MYVWNGFHNLFRHESNKISDYDEGLFTGHVIHWKKTENYFLLLVAVINMFIFLFLLSSIQEIFHWFLPVGVCVWISKYEIDYGVSLDLL